MGHLSLTPVAKIVRAVRLIDGVLHSHITQAVMGGLSNPRGIVGTHSIPCHAYPYAHHNTSKLGYHTPARTSLCALVPLPIMSITSQPTNGVPVAKIGRGGRI